jgi:putative membrane protein
MRNIKIFAQVGLAVACFLPFAAAQTAPPQNTSTLSAGDQMFVKKAAQGGMAEVQLGQLATQKASSQDVKQFGQRMVDDHSKGNEQLKQLAESKGVHLPQKLSAKDRETMDSLSKLSGKQFDKAYMADMVKDHREDIAEFHHESASGSDTQVKEFAKGALPMLDSHLKQAEKINTTEMAKK